jgi:hypothetical protein
MESALKHSTLVYNAEHCNADGACSSSLVINDSVTFGRNDRDGMS